MKRCAKCGKEYEDAYDGCPRWRCAHPVLRFLHGYLRFNQIALAIGVALVLVLTLWFSMR